MISVVSLYYSVKNLYRTPSRVANVYIKYPFFSRAETFAPLIKRGCFDRTVQDSPATERISPFTRRPSRQEKETSKPPRAFNPETSPRDQAAGKAGNK